MTHYISEPGLVSVWCSINLLYFTLLSYYFLSYVFLFFFPSPPDSSSSFSLFLLIDFLSSSFLSWSSSSFLSCHFPSFSVFGFLFMFFFCVLLHCLFLQVRNLMSTTTEETLRHEFSQFKPGCVERVKKLTDYAFVHYRSREEALTALRLMNGTQVDGATVEVLLAKPSRVREAATAEGKSVSKATDRNTGGGRRGGNEVSHRKQEGIVGPGESRSSPLRSPSLPPGLTSSLHPREGVGKRFVVGGLQWYCAVQYSTPRGSCSSSFCLTNVVITANIKLSISDCYQ